MKTVLEIACFNLPSAIMAGESGAGRIELCANACFGGTTPLAGWLSAFREKFSIPVFVMIRPRGGNFVFSEAEMAEMERSMELLRDADGFVFGCLTADRTVDHGQNKRLLELAGGKPCTFHRAFDETADLKASLESIVDLGFSRVLTGGGQGPAIKNLAALSSLKDQAAGRILILPGGGVRASHIEQLAGAGFTEFHSSALLPGQEVCDPIEIGNLLMKIRSGS